MRNRATEWLFAVLLMVSPGWVFAQAFTETRTGTIAAGDQFDLYTLNLPAGLVITGTLGCDELTPGGSRPLDPVLSVYFPGSDPSDVANADVYNDDGFGADDDPAGVNCDAFQSSRVIFTVPAAGSYVFRADGFGSSTGPYTLVVRGELPLSVPTLGTVGLVLMVLGMSGVAFFIQRRRPRPVVRGS